MVFIFCLFLGPWAKLLECFFIHPSQVLCEFKALSTNPFMGQDSKLFHVESASLGEEVNFSNNSILAMSSRLKPSPEPAEFGNASILHPFAIVTRRRPITSASLMVVSQVCATTAAELLRNQAPACLEDAIVIFKWQRWPQARKNVNQLFEKQWQMDVVPHQSLHLGRCHFWDHR